MGHFIQSGCSDFLTDHCRQRMTQRGISRSVLEDVMQYGRESFHRGAVIYFVGAREVARFSELGADLNHCMNVHVVCDPNGSTVITTYVNQRMSRPCRHRYNPRRTQPVTDAPRPPAPQARYRGWNLPSDENERQAS